MGMQLASFTPQKEAKSAFRVPMVDPQRWLIRGKAAKHNRLDLTDPRAFERRNISPKKNWHKNDAWSPFLITFANF